MWTDKLKIGDLIWSRQDGKPAIVLVSAETARAKYGDLVNKRMQFKLHIDGEQGWLDEGTLRALYKIP
jgi:hypothetical protein